MKVKEALSRLNIEAEVRSVTISDTRSGPNEDEVSRLLSMWERNGVAMLPAALIVDELVLHGGVPSEVKIVWAIARHKGVGRGFIPAPSC